MGESEVDLDLDDSQKKKKPGSHKKSHTRKGDVDWKDPAIVAAFERCFQPIIDDCRAHIEAGGDFAVIKWDTVNLMYTALEENSDSLCLRVNINQCYNRLCNYYRKGEGRKIA